MGIKLKISLALTLLILTLNISAQKKDDIVRAADNAETLLSQNNPAAAERELLPVLQAAEGTELEPQVQFLYALTQYQLGKIKTAKPILLDLRNRFKSWDGFFEIQLLLAKIYFEEGAYLKAYKQKSQITGEITLKRLSKIEKHYLKAASTDTLKMLYKKYPDEGSIQQMLLSRVKNDPDEKELAAELRENRPKSKQQADSKKNDQVPKSKKKSYYKVAVLLPLFLEDSTAVSEYIKNRLAFQAVRWSIAAQLAIDSVNSNGGKDSIRLDFYDTRRDSTTVARLLMIDSLKKSDVIVGPMTGGYEHDIADFCYENEILNFNPFIIPDSQDIENPFLVHATVPIFSQANLISQFASDSIFSKWESGLEESEKVKTDTAVYIIYEDTEKDTSLAFYLNKELMRRGKKIGGMLKLGPNSLKDIHKFFRGKDSIDNAGLMIFITRNQNNAANLISSMDLFMVEAPIITFGDWLNFSIFSVEQLAEKKIYFVDDFYIVNEKNKEQFEKKFISQFNMVPNSYDLMMYERMLLLGQSLKAHGDFFINEIAGEQLDAVFSPGYFISKNSVRENLIFFRFEGIRVENFNVILQDESSTKQGVLRESSE